jgi:hypothetical protein
MEAILNLCAMGRLCMKIMQKKHDVPMVKHYGERTTKVAIGRRFYSLEMK